MGRLVLHWVCVFALVALPVGGCSDETGDGGSGGSAGSGGVGGEGGVVGEACVPSERECVNSEIGPIEEMCEIVVPDQPSACDGTESTVNPTSCNASGNTVVHKLTQLQIVADCNTGYNLDGCDGFVCSTPLVGVADDGANGVDSALAIVGSLVEQGFPGCDDALGRMDQALHDATCTGAIDIEIEVDTVPEEGCAVVRLSALGATSDPIPMKLSDDGCLSGTVGTIPISLGDIQGAIENAAVRMTVSSLGFSDGILGGTTRGDLLGAMLDETCEGSSAVAQQFADINADLSGNSLVQCDSLSMTLEIGGTAIPVQDGGQ